MAEELQANILAEQEAARLRTAVAEQEQRVFNAIQAAQDAQEETFLVRIRELIAAVKEE